MFADKTYEEIKKGCCWRDFDTEGMSNVEMVKILLDLKFDVSLYNNFKDFERCIVFVQSLNNSSKFHTVFWDGDMVYDSQKDMEGKLYYTFRTFMAARKFSVVRMTDVKEK